MLYIIYKALVYVTYHLTNINICYISSSRQWYMLYSICKGLLYVIYHLPGIDICYISSNRQWYMLYIIYQVLYRHGEKPPNTRLTLLYRLHASENFTTLTPNNPLVSVQKTSGHRRRLGRLLVGTRIDPLRCTYSLMMHGWTAQGQGRG
jgi:hypothetical protein